MTVQAKGLGKAALQPVAKFTSVLWLEVTGLFYAIFAALLGAGASRKWATAFGGAGTGDRGLFCLYAGVAAVFAYFSLTNFWKARQRGRR